MDAWMHASIALDDGSFVSIVQPKNNTGIIHVNFTHLLTWTAYFDRSRVNKFILHPYPKIIICDQNLVILLDGGKSFGVIWLSTGV